VAAVAVSAVEDGVEACDFFQEGLTGAGLIYSKTQLPLSVSQWASNDTTTSINSRSSSNNHDSRSNVPPDESLDLASTSS
jgi:hypothetical protein